MAKIIDRCCIVTTVLLLATCVLDTSAFNTSTVWISFLHLLAFTFLMGVQFWTIGVAGLVMIRTLPRHMFSLVQSELFPAYFSTCFATSTLTLTALLLRHPYPDWTDVVERQVVTLAVVAGLSLVQRCFLAGKNNQLVRKMEALEKEAGVGMAVGPITHEELLANPEYRGLKKRFGMWHGMTMLAGLVALLASVYHVWFLAQRVKI